MEREEKGKKNRMMFKKEGEGKVQKEEIGKRKREKSIHIKQQDRKEREGKHKKKRMQDKGNKQQVQRKEITTFNNNVESG